MVKNSDLVKIQWKKIRVHKFWKFIDFFLNRKELIIVLVLGLTPLLWFREGHLILGADSRLPINALENIQDYSYIWNSKLDAGFPISSQGFLYPIAFAILHFGFE